MASFVGDMLYAARFEMSLWLYYKANTETFSHALYCHKTLQSFENTWEILKKFSRVLKCPSCFMTVFFICCQAAVLHTRSRSAMQGPDEKIWTSWEPIILLHLTEDQHAI